jgi:hypothetical protein
MKSGLLVVIWALGMACACRWWNSCGWQGAMSRVGISVAGVIMIYLLLRCLSDEKK